MSCIPQGLVRPPARPYERHVPIIPMYGDRARGGADLIALGAREDLRNTQPRSPPDNLAPTLGVGGIGCAKRYKPTVVRQFAVGPCISMGGIYRF